jgi:hypothetical protein
LAGESPAAGKAGGVIECDDGSAATLADGSQTDIISEKPSKATYGKPRAIVTDVDRLRAFGRCPDRAVSIAINVVPSGMNVRSEKEAIQKGRREARQAGPILYASVQANPPR